MKALLEVAHVLGSRTMLAFGFIAFLVTALLCAVNVSSHYAMASYIDDQINRVPWDFSIYETELPFYESVQAQLLATPGIIKGEGLFFLRANLPRASTAFIDGKPLYTPWVSLLSATDPDLVPPDLRPTGNGATLVLVGSKAQMGEAFLNLQHTKQLEVRLSSFKPDPARPQFVGRVPELVFPLERTIRIDGSELNRWFMEKTSAPTLVPEIGLILVVPYAKTTLLAFDALARGSPVRLDDGELHSEAVAEYFPDVIHLAGAERSRLVSGWDVAGSRAALATVATALQAKINSLIQSAAIDPTLGVMFDHMDRIARQIGLLTLLVSIPLLGMAWVLLGNVCSLLLLNDRRTLGLMRLRGVPGATISRALTLSVLVGGLVGGLLGALFGTYVPLIAYGGWRLPLRVVAEIENPAIVLTYLLVALGLGLAASRRFIRYAASISPLAASSRVNAADVEMASTRFGWLGMLAVGIGGIKVVSWAAGWSLSADSAPAWVLTIERVGDFVAFPLLVYGLVTFVASQAWLLRALLKPTIWLISGNMRELVLANVELSRHRAASFLLIVGLMSSLCLYPTVMTSVFDNKTERAARVQLGGDLQLTLNALDLMPPEAQARGSLHDRAELLAAKLTPLVAALRKDPGVAGAEFVIEGLVEGLYMPGHGFSGVPVYLIDRAGDYLAATYHEPALGVGGRFADLVAGLGSDNVLVSPTVDDFYKRKRGAPMPVGNDVTRTMNYAPLGGIIRFLPGMPSRTVNDREGFVAARVDYINYLFGENPFFAGSLAEKNLANLDVLMPRVVIAVRARPGQAVDALKQRILASLALQPMEVRTAAGEVARLGSDMYIFLARQNVAIYLIGGIMLAIIGILAVAVANFIDARRLLALLRIRGCGPAELLRFFAPLMLAPSLVGLVLGGAVALGVGYGITDLVWKLRDIQTILNYLETRLTVGSDTLALATFLVLLVVVLTVAFSRWVFRRTAREGLLDV